LTSEIFTGNEASIFHNNNNNNNGGGASDDDGNTSNLNTMNEVNIVY
jgi:hypothetical protein